MRWFICLALAACTQSYGPPAPQPPQMARDAFTDAAYPALLAHYGFGSSCTAILSATAFPDMLCFSEPYDAIVASYAVFRSHEQARNVLMNGAAPGQVLPWDANAAFDVLRWLDLEDEAGRWGGGSYEGGFGPGS